MTMHTPTKHEVETFSGLYVDTEDPRPDTIRLEDIAHALANTCRYGGHCSRFYSVAEHAVFCSIRIERKGGGRRTRLPACTTTTRRRTSGTSRPRSSRCSANAVMEGEDNDPDSGLPHEYHALACLAIIIDARATGKLIDDRNVAPKSAPQTYRDVVNEATAHVARLQEKHADRDPHHYTIQDSVQ
jgi:hypothetical protein